MRCVSLILNENNIKNGVRKDEIKCVNIRINILWMLSFKILS